MDRDAWDCSERSQVELLPYWLIQVAGAGRDKCGEILDLPNCVSRNKKLTEFLRVEPAKTRIAQRSIVEVEAVYVDVCGQL